MQERDLLHRACEVLVNFPQATVLDWLTSWDILASVRMSQICMRGFVGDSSITSLVSPGLSAFLKALHPRQPLVDLSQGTQARLSFYRSNAAVPLPASSAQ